MNLTAAKIHQVLKAAHVSRSTAGRKAGAGAETGYSVKVAEDGTIEVRHVIASGTYYDDAKAKVTIIELGRYTGILDRAGISAVRMINKTTGERWLVCSYKKLEEEGK